MAEESLLDVAVSRLRVWAEYPGNGGPPVWRKDVRRALEGFDAALARAEAAEARLAEAERLLREARRFLPNGDVHAGYDDEREAARLLDAFLAPAPVAPPEAPDALPVAVVPVAYALTGVPEVRIEWCGIDSWAVRRMGGDVLTRNGAWEWEPMPSNRTEKFMARARWPSVAKAVAALRASRKAGGE